jgi:hypothetical protein
VRYAVNHHYHHHRALAGSSSTHNTVLSSSSSSSCLSGFSDNQKAICFFYVGEEATAATGRPLSLLDLRLASRRTAIGPLISDEKERGKTKKKISSAVDIFFLKLFQVPSHGIYIYVIFRSIITYSSRAYLNIDERNDDGTIPREERLASKK